MKLTAVNTKEPQLYTVKTRTLHTAVCKKHQHIAMCAMIGEQFITLDREFFCFGSGGGEDTQFVCPAGTAWVTKRIGRTAVNSIQDRGGQEIEEKEKVSS